MDNMCQNGRKGANVRHFLPWKITFKTIQSNQNGQLISTILVKVHAEIENKLDARFWENGLKCKKGKILPF